MEEKEEESDEEDMIVRKTEEMVPRWFHKYLKMFEKKDLERMPTKKTWDHAIDLREGFVPKKRKIYPLSVKTVDSRLHLFLFFLFRFIFLFYFLFLEQLRLGVISHTVTSVTT